MPFPSLSYIPSICLAFAISIVKHVIHKVYCWHMQWHKPRILLSYYELPKFVLCHRTFAHIQVCELDVKQICRQSRSETSRLSWETKKAQKVGAERYDKYIPGMYLVYAFHIRILVQVGVCVTCSRKKESSESVPRLGRANLQHQVVPTSSCTQLCCEHLQLVHIQ